MDIRMLVLLCALGANDPQKEPGKPEALGVPTQQIASADTIGEALKMLEGPEVLRHPTQLTPPENTASETPKEPNAADPDKSTEKEEPKDPPKALSDSHLPKTPVPGHCWIRAEYLYWWTKGNYLPPLVTTSPQGTPFGVAGVLGLPTTTILLGGDTLDPSPRSGARLTGGWWLDDHQDCGIEGSFFALLNKSRDFPFVSTGDPILARPFFDVLTNQQRIIYTAFPGVVTGSLDISLGSTSFLGADLHGLFNIYRRCWCRIDVLAGYRFLNLKESLTIRDVEIDAQNGDIFAPTDHFGTGNQFHGVDCGISAEFRRGRWYADVVARMALGINCREVSINGATTNTVGGVTTQFPFGLLALPSNIGRFTDVSCGVVPEFALRAGYELGPNARIFAGYTALGWTGVVRPGDQIDLGINTNQLPPPGPGGPARPAYHSRGSEFWAGGFSLGLEFRY